MELFSGAVVLIDTPIASFILLNKGIGILGKMNYRDSYCVTLNHFHMA